MAEEPPSTLAVGRRSRRVRKKRNFSPEVEIVVKGRKVSRGDRAAGQGRQDSGTGRGFCCDLCSSPYIVYPGRRGNQLKTSSSLPSPRHKWDPRTGQVLTLCKACGLTLSRPRSTPNPVKDPGLDERKRHEEQLQAFGWSMVELLRDQDGSKLCCPAYTRKPCLCLQNYLKAPGLGESENRTRALEFLKLLQESKQLKAVKFCSDGDSQKAGEPRTQGVGRRAVGLGRSQRRSLAFEDFVLKNRRVLCEELKLCERATQRILGYSNNFLHKKLKTSSQKPARAERKKGKGALGLLKPIAELGEEKCCADNCTVMAQTYGRLLQHWRDRALMGQSEARRVLAEMLMPSEEGLTRSSGWKLKLDKFRLGVRRTPSRTRRVLMLGRERNPVRHHRWLPPPQLVPRSCLQPRSMGQPQLASHPPLELALWTPAPRRRPCLCLALSQHHPALRGR
ncbi:uncharacterized protein LOC141999908 [Natator depressus]|uniref:uncharacterized protein LOC141999908 n=1 Tax=Natator depressus TaxID=27790 RepID=UPI003EBF986B